MTTIQTYSHVNGEKLREIEIVHPQLGLFDEALKEHNFVMSLQS